MIRAVGELDCYSAYIHLREPDKSEGKAELVTYSMHKVQSRGGGRSEVTFAFSTLKRMGETEYPNSLIYPVEKLCTSSKILQRNLMEDKSYQFLTNGDRCY
ncbi:hypothetical protein GW17_00054457 [Ensete ventricosum]|nr:hypothetical protein GW17_00054457 [Ensete ventricosum]